MSGIIQDAKQLLKLVDEERADLESRGAEPDEYGGFEMWLHATVLYDNAKEVRESIKELAEETWEYAVQVKIGAKWLFLGKGFGGHNFAKNACWFEKKEKAQKYQLVRRETAPTRLVRRRVSPPEVISE